MPATQAYYQYLAGNSRSTSFYRSVRYNYIYSEFFKALPRRPFYPEQLSAHKSVVTSRMRESPTTMYTDAATGSPSLLSLDKMVHSLSQHTNSRPSGVPRNEDNLQKTNSDLKYCLNMMGCTILYESEVFDGARTYYSLLGPTNELRAIARQRSRTLSGMEKPLTPNGSELAIFGAYYVECTPISTVTFASDYLTVIFLNAPEAEVKRPSPRNVTFPNIMMCLVMPQARRGAI
ncbi:hypothetical protein C8Q80DRAFT_1344896 [Daedaleopsis nitida]|nr:hypothetical protein C8Q80DRAFT_1344896 [Daedaleopsis nitida]